MSPAIRTPTSCCSNPTSATGDVLANIFGYAQRRALAEHATRRPADLRSRRRTLGRCSSATGCTWTTPRWTIRIAGWCQASAAAGALARPVKRLEEVLDDLELALASAA